MRRPGRNDTTLLIGVTVALLVVFQRPLRYALEWAHALEKSSGLAIVSGLVILAVVVLVNVLARRSDERVRSTVAQVTARERDERTTEMDRLVRFGQRLSTARSMDGLRDVLRHAFREFAHSDGIWALIRTGGKWEAVAGGLPGIPHRASPELEALANRVLHSWDPTHLRTRRARSGRATSASHWSRVTPVSGSSGSGRLPTTRGMTSGG